MKLQLFAPTKQMKSLVRSDPMNSYWWYTYPSEKYEFVSWDDELFPTEWKVIKFHGSKPPNRIDHHDYSIIHHIITMLSPYIPY